MNQETETVIFAERLPSSITERPLKKNIPACFALLLLLIGKCMAQQYNFRHYQVENGLSNNAVVCMLQDTNGFIWFGTKDGLNRFDGYTFKVFRHNPDNSASIGSNFVHCLHEDKNGMVWIGTDKGIYRYNAVSESFSKLSDHVTGAIADVTTGPDGSLWFIMNQMLYRYLFPTKQLIFFDPARFGSFTSLCILPSNIICLGTPDGFIRQYHMATQKMLSTDVFVHSPPTSSRWIERIYSLGNGNVLVGTSNQGAKLLHIPTLTYTDILTHENNTDLFVRNFLQVSDSIVWIASESGIFIYNLYNRHYINLKKAYNNPFSLSDNAVYAFCKDKEGGIWAGSYFGGANYYPRQHASFQKIFPVPNENSLSGNVVRELEGDQWGNIWIGTEDAGLNKLNPVTGKLSSYLPDGKKGSISYTNIHGLLADGHRLWIGTFEHGLDLMDIPTGKIIQHFSKGQAPGELKSNFIHCITKTREGAVLLGTTIGAYRFNRSCNNFTPLPGMPLNNWYSYITEASDGTIWAATYGNGVRYYHPATGKEGNFIYQRGQEGSIPDNRVNSIYEDSSGHLWFATESGISKWNSKDSSFHTYTIADGLPTDYTLSILEDSKKNMWVSTSKGMAMLPHGGDKFTFFTTANGLLSDQFNFNSAFKDSCGKMYFGCVKGLITFNPESFSDNPFMPPVFITGIQVFNQELAIDAKGSPLKKSISYTQSIHLPYDQSTLSIDFAALAFSAPEMTAYAYRMKGLDENWVYLKRNRKAYFTKLKPGIYTFEVKAAAGNEQWNTTPASITIEIQPPWWATNWAYLLYCLLGISIFAYILLAYHKYTTSKSKRKYELLKAAKEKEIFKAKIDFFTNVAHEIKTPLTLIKAPLEKVMKKAEGMTDITGNLKIMDRNTNRLIDLTNQLLDFRQTEINGFSLNFTYVNIPELLEDTFNSFKPLAEEKGLRYRIQYPEDAVQAYIDLDAFKKILYNLFSNAIKYATEKVYIQLLPVKEGDALFSIHFVNDGFVIPADMREQLFEPFFRMKETQHQTGSGIGLTLSRSLAVLHGGSITVDADAAGCNLFSLQLPLHQPN